MYGGISAASLRVLTGAQNRHPQLDELPAVYAALKADLDKTTQRAEIQPDVYTRELGMSAPLHVSAAWAPISELFVTVCPESINDNNDVPIFIFQSDPGILRLRKLHCHQAPLLPGQSQSRLIEQICILQQGSPVGFSSHSIVIDPNKTRIACTIITLFFMWKRSNPG